MKQFLKSALIGMALVGAFAAVLQARKFSDLPAVKPTVVTIQPGVAADAVLVTYFSSDVRCATCLRIERLSRATVERNFAQELRNGRVNFRVINLDGDGNDHYVKDYSLISKTIIVSELAQGQEIRWENLQQVWTRQKDEPAFEVYLVDAVKRHLGEAT
jgi:hypothetical protein